MRMAFIATFVLVTAPPLWGQEPAPQRLKVCVLGRTGVEAPLKSERKVLEKELKNKEKEAERRRKDLDKQLEKQYGKKRAEWPTDAKHRYSGALREERVAHQALVELDYKSCTQKDIDDSVQDLKDAIVGKAQIKRYSDRFLKTDEFRQEMASLMVVRLVDSHEEADLAIEVLGRRPCRISYSFMNELKSRFVGIRERECSIVLLLKLMPGDQLNAQLMSEIDWAEISNYKRGRLINMIHKYESDDPNWVFELMSFGGLGWTGLAVEAALVIVEFVNENRAALLAERSEELALPSPSSSPLKEDEIGGKQVFLTHACDLCHTVKGQGIPNQRLTNMMGGDLSNIGNERKQAKWLKSYIQGNQKGGNGLFHDQIPTIEGSIIEGLPQTKFALTDNEMDALVKWLTTLKVPEK